MLCKALQVILDCGGDEGQPEGLESELLWSLTVLSPNETELARMTGKVSHFKVCFACWQASEVFRPGYGCRHALSPQCIMQGSFKQT